MCKLREIKLNEKNDQNARTHNAAEAQQEN
jgi:hypothetical protein